MKRILGGFSVAFVLYPASTWAGTTAQGTLDSVTSDISPGEVWLKVCAIFFLLFLNAFFVASQSAIVRARGHHFDEGTLDALRAKTITGNLEAYVSAIQLGITMSSLALGWLGEPFIANGIKPLFGSVVRSPTILHTLAILLAFSVITALHVVMGELLPKAIGVQKAVKTTLIVARPLSLFYYFFRWPTTLLNATANYLLRRVFRLQPLRGGEATHSSDELRHLVEESNGSSDVTETERSILLNTLELSDLEVRDIMTPRNDVVCFDVNQPFAKNWAIAMESKNTRYPLVDGHLDTTLGIVHIKDMLTLLDALDKALRKIAKPFTAVPELAPVDKVLGDFLRNHVHLTIVVDEFGSAVGIISMEDLLEEVVGDIRDEFDEEIDETEFYRINEDEFRVDGGLGLYELSDFCDLVLETPDVSSIGGYVTQRFGRLPESGEKTEIEGYVVTVTKSDGRRIEELHFQRKTDDMADETTDTESVTLSGGH